MIDPPRKTKRGLWDRRSGAAREAQELTRIIRAGKCKPGRKPRPGPRTRGENFQHWRMRHGVSAGDLVRVGVSHDQLALLFRFERGSKTAAGLTNRELIPLAHAVLKARDMKAVAQVQGEAQEAVA